MIVDDYIFDSIQESKRYKELKLLLRAGKIQELELQPHFLLQDSFRKNGKTYRKIEYIADFKYIENDQTVFERQPLEKLAEIGELACYKHKGFWQCMDTLRDKKKLETLWENGRAPWKIWEE